MRRQALSVLAGSILTLAACGGSDEPKSQSEVVASDVYTALIDWEIDNYEPVVDEDGDVELPVIYIAAADGRTIDVGIQASVAEATVDDAIVRFADDSQEALDDDLDDVPVKDDGVLLIMGDVPEPSRTIEVVVVRYRSVDEEEFLTIEITASSTGAQVNSAQPN